MKRREFMLGSMRLGALALVPGASAAAAPYQPGVPLKMLGSPCGLKIGIQAERRPLETSALAQIVAANFNLLTPGNELKWARLRQTPTSYNFADADWMVNFAEEHGMLIHGHNLCWNAPAGNPPWLTEVLTKDNARRYLTEHITTVMTRYKGRIDSWDIVNEPIVPWSKRADGLYPGIWLNLLGPEYIEIAFDTAAAADPKALRVLNIYHVEQASPDNEKGRELNLEFLENCVQRKVPVQAVGIESHLNAGQPLGGPAFTRFLAQIRGLGLKVLITELDVNDTSVAGNLQSRDTAVAQYYYDYLTQALPAGEVDRLIFWTPSDKFDWLDSIHNTDFQRSDGGSHRPGLWDANFTQKPAYSSVTTAIGAVCRRR